MPTNPSGVKSWEQSTMFPTEAMRITCVIGVEPMRDRHHVSIRWMDDDSGELLGMWAAPGRAQSFMLGDLDEFLRRIRELAESVLNPF